MFAVDSQRPPKLYQYAERQTLERSLTLGEFRLLPAGALRSVPQILPFNKTGVRPASAENYLTLSMATAWDQNLFDRIPGADCCLLIHQPEEFGERIHRAVLKMLPAWAGIDAAVSYGMPSPLGKVFSKAKRDADEREWLFAWRPTQATPPIRPIVIQIGNIEAVAELRMKGA